MVLCNSSKINQIEVWSLPVCSKPKIRSQMLSDRKGCPIGKRSQQNASFNSSANDQPFAIVASSSSKIKKQIFILAFLSFLFILNINLNRKFRVEAVDLDEEQFYDPYMDFLIENPNHPFLETGSTGYDYLILNMQWPTTVLGRMRDEGAGGNLSHYWDHVNRFGYRFTINGLWAGVNGEPMMGDTRRK